MQVCSAALKLMRSSETPGRRAGRVGRVGVSQGQGRQQLLLAQGLAIFRLRACGVTTAPRSQAWSRAMERSQSFSSLPETKRLAMEGSD